MRTGMERPRSLKEAKASGRAVLPGEFTAQQRLAYVLTRPFVWGPALALIVCAIMYSLWSAGAFEGERLEHNRAIEFTDDSGNPFMETVDGVGVYVDENDKVTEILTDEPLPEEIREEVESALATEVDLAESGVSDAVDLLGTRLASTGKPFAVIVPARLACDDAGENYFDGYAVTGDVNDEVLATDLSLCLMQETLEGARELADLLIASDPIAVGSAEIFEVGLERAHEAHRGDESEPVTQETVYEEWELTEEELATHAGEF